MKKMNAIALVLVSAFLGGCVVVTEDQLTGSSRSEALFTQTMLPAPSTNSDAVIAGVGYVPHETRQVASAKIWPVITFDEYNEKAELLHTVHFNTGSHQLTKSEVSALTSNAYRLPKEVILTGYADPRGGSAYNQQLSENRVKSVARVLDGMGIKADKRCAYGKSRLPVIRNCRGMYDE